MNGMTGFVECFRANYFCRLCKRSRVQTEKDYKEHVIELRTIEQYEADVYENNVSQTGIKARGIFNRIPSFHVTDNFVCDIMHDVLEGALVYGLQHSLHYFIYTKQFLTVHELNHRKPVSIR